MFKDLIEAFGQSSVKDFDTSDAPEMMPKPKSQKKSPPPIPAKAALKGLGKPISNRALPGVRKESVTMFGNILSELRLELNGE